MRRFVTRIHDVYLAAIATATAAVMMPRPAHATTVGDIFNNLIAAGSSAPKLLSMGAYIGGLWFGINALMKFHAHSQNPQSVPAKEIWSKAVVSGGLLSIGYILMALAGSISGGGGGNVTVPSLPNFG